MDRGSDLLARSQGEDVSTVPGKFVSLQRGRRFAEGGKGNTLGLLHGLYSDRVRAPIEEQFADALRSAMAESLHRVYSEVLDEHAIRRAARAMATVEIVEAQIDQEGVDSLSDRAFVDYQRASTQLDRYLDRLGMTPAARARLGVDVARTTSLVEAIESKRKERES